MTIIIVVNCDSDKPKPLGDTLYKIAAHKMPTAAVLISAEKTFKIKKIISQAFPFL